MPKATILLGLPLAGKSTWINDVWRPQQKGGNFQIVSADTHKENHPDYNPEYAHLLHEWSVKEAESDMNKFSNSGIDLMMDGGGINNSYTVRIIKMLQKKGYTVDLVHIKTPLEVCLYRNSMRERKVPVEAINEKAAKEIQQFYRLSKICDNVEVIDYFTDKHIFVDMDGVIAALTTLPKIGGKIDFVNSRVFEHLQPVTPVIKKLMDLGEKGHIIYIMSATPNSFSFEEKNAWLDIHFPVSHDRRYFVNSGRHKAEMLDNLTSKLKLDKKDVTLIDDTHSTLYDVKDLCMKPMHISEFLIHEF